MEQFCKYLVSHGIVRKNKGTNKLIHRLVFFSSNILTDHKHNYLKINLPFKGVGCRNPVKTVLGLPRFKFILGIAPT